MWYFIDMSLTVGTFLECKCRVMDAHGKFGEHERSMRVAGAKAESRSTVRIFCMYETCIERPCLNRCSLESTARKLPTANILCVHCIFPSNEQYVCSYYMLNHRINILLFHCWIIFWYFNFYYVCKFFLRLYLTIVSIA